MSLQQYCNKLCWKGKRTLNFRKSYLNETLLEVIDGHMLGDGWIMKPASLISTRLGIRQKEREFAQYMTDFFVDYFEAGNAVANYKKKYDKRTGKHYESWNARTLHHPDFLDQYKRWYPNGKKIVPQDVRLTPLSVMIWYLGDGTLDRGARSGTNPRVCFATQSFTIQDINTNLMPFFNTLAPDKFMVSGRNEIRGRKGSIVPFFKFIGQKSPVSCYAYKFMSCKEIKECYKRAIVNSENSWFKRNLNYAKIGEMHKQGATTTQIADQLGYAYQSVWQVLHSHSSNTLSFFN